MREYIIHRLVLVIPIMLGVGLLTFAIFRIIPGDSCITTLVFGATPETIKAARRSTAWMSRGISSTEVGF